MNNEPAKAYIYQPVPVPESGKAFRVIFTNGDRTPLLTKEDAEYVLRESEKCKLVSLKSSIRKALKEQEWCLI